VSRLRETIAGIAAVDPAVGAETQRLLDEKTKPRRSLGRLEDLACRFAAIRGTPVPPMPEKALVVMAADHGVVSRGVSAYPQEVTAQMLANFASGGAGVNVLARQAGARVIVVDMGVIAAPSHLPAVLARRIGPGTKDFTAGPAMSRDEAEAALEVGIALAAELARDGITLLGIGEMGIGNTTAASALTACLTGASVREVTGRGTGIDAATLARKVAIVEEALAVNRLAPPGSADPLDVLARLGGFEVAGLAGVVLGAAAARVPVLVDGFIAAAAALVATRLAPRAEDYLIASHLSVEAGHAHLLRALGLVPLLDLELRLGEGTGSALAMGLVDAALRILHEMASFAEAGVADSGA